MKTKKNTLKLSATSFFVAFTIAFLLTSCGNDPFSKVETKNSVTKVGNVILFDDFDSWISQIKNGQIEDKSLKIKGIEIPGLYSQNESN
mgnify:CR=1 FL=1